MLVEDHEDSLRNPEGLLVVEPQALVSVSHQVRAHQVQDPKVEDHLAAASRALAVVPTMDPADGVPSESPVAASHAAVVACSNALAEGGRPAWYPREWVLSKSWLAAMLDLLEVAVGCYWANLHQQPHPRHRHLLQIQTMASL